MIRAVFFDLGNTLLFHNDFVSIYHATAQLSAAVSAWIPEIDQKILADRYYRSLQNYYQQRDIDLLELSADTFLRTTLLQIYAGCVPEYAVQAGLTAFYQQTQLNWHLTLSAHETMDHLRKQGLKIGLITNASYAGDIRTLLEKYHLNDRIDKVIISAEVGYRKPHKEIFQTALAHVNVLPSESVMIGDSFTADIVGAWNMGMHAVWFKCYSSYALAESEKRIPTAVIEDLSVLPALIERMNSSFTL